MKECMDIPFINFNRVFLLAIASASDESFSAVHVGSSGYRKQESDFFTKELEIL